MKDLHLTTKYESGAHWPEAAVKIVQEWAIESLKVPSDTAFYIVWFAFILGDWKALVSSTEADGRYYEVTQNIIKGETYVDTYKKTHNIMIKNNKE